MGQAKTALFFGESTFAAVVLVTIELFVRFAAFT